MRTLIELYDERPLDNVLATEVFRPETTVILCPPEIDQNRTLKENLRAYFENRGCETEIRFQPVSLLDAEKVAQSLRKVIAKYPDCALDIAGGTDAALFAGGLVSAETSLPVFTYSRRRNTFFDIRGAEFARDVPCLVTLRVQDCFQMAGGAMLPGRMDNQCLSEYLPIADDFFRIYQQNRQQWPNIVTYIQRISQAALTANGPLTASGPMQVRDNGRVLEAPERALASLEQLGLISGLSVDPAVGVRFDFRDENICFFLRDVGSVLELYTYKAALDAGIFQDVRLSAVVNWEAGRKHTQSVTNELDVVAVRGVMPVFISCKTCEIKTEALNELAVLRDRFGSAVSRAVIVTTGGSVRPVTRHRAFELGIEVIDQNDLKTETGLRDRLRVIADWPEIQDNPGGSEPHRL